MSNKVDNVIAQVLGGEKVVVDQVETVQDVLNQLELSGSYACSVNGEPESPEFQLCTGDYVTIAPAVKGGTL